MKYFLLLFTMIATTSFAQDKTIETFLEKWENSKIYLVAVANAMPENKYDYKPTEREMTFGKQLLHIKENMDWLSSTYFTDTPKKEIQLDKILSKAEIIASLEKSFDAVADIIKNTKIESLNDKVEFFAGSKTKLQILNLLQDHVTHHRGQILVYLNLNGIEPPKYTGW